MDPWHVTLAAVSRGVLFPEEERMRRAVRCLARIVACDALLFCIVDDHAHIVLLCDRARAGRLAHSLILALGALADRRFQPAHFQPVETRKHMLALVPYVLTQTRHHNIPCHPARWNGSCLHDIVGARAIPGLRLRLGEVLPRVRVDRMALEAVELGSAPLKPASLLDLQDIGRPRLRNAVSAGACVSTRLSGNDPPVPEARSVLANLATLGRSSRSNTAETLGCTPRAVHRLLERPVDIALVRATRLRLALDARLDVLGDGRAP